MLVKAGLMFCALLVHVFAALVSLIPVIPILIIIDVIHLLAYERHIHLGFLYGGYIAFTLGWKCYDWVVDYIIKWIEKKANEL